jgi:ABC-2 type transport system ATP-binding protein
VSEAILAIENLSLTVRAGHLIPEKKRILHDISFEVQRGKATAYLGPNGAGKTSTFRILAGLCEPDGGRILFDGTPVTTKLPAARIGFMPEQPYFYKNLSPMELLESFARLSGLHLDIRKRIREWADRLEFASVLNQRLASCSKGQIQRVGLAQALIHEPEFVILDEPFSGLDPLGRECVRHAILEETRRGATLLFSSHILDDAESLCEQVVVLHHGEVAYAGDMKSLLAGQEGWLLWIDWPEASFPEYAGAEVKINADRSLEVCVASEDAKNAILRLTLDHPSARIISVTPERRSLESAFVDLLHEKTNAS